MSKERIVTVIPPTPKLMYRVAIYCRVSTRSQEQMNILANQILHLTKFTAVKVNWRLVHIYIDIKFGRDTTIRNEFQRMINDCENGKIDIIIKKT